MIFLILWTLFFAMQLFVLQSNKDDVEGYVGTSKGWGYFLLAFENGIGNISPPTVEVWYSKDSQSYSAGLLIFFIYAYWIMSQFILLIVLLNFVIALISGVYESVMDFKIIYEFKQKQELNAESDRFYKFLAYLRSFGKDQEPVDQVFLINGIQEQEDNDEYIGMIQTFKKIIKESDANVEAKIENVNAKVEDVNAKVDGLKDQMTEMMSMIKEMKKE